MKIVVLVGGISTERDVSIVSGTQICTRLREKGYQAMLADIYFGFAESKSASRFEEYLSIEEELDYIKSFTRFDLREGKRGSFFGEGILDLCQEADIVFMALHGENGENGKVQATFDLLGIPYTGTGALGSALAMDKGIAKDIFMNHQIPTPRGFQLTPSSSKELKDYEISLPVVVKPANGGSSIGVTIVKEEGEWDNALKVAFDLEDRIIVEEYIEGREFSIGFMEDKVYPPIEIRPLVGFYDYENKYKAGAATEICPAPISEEKTKEMGYWALRVKEALRLEVYGRIDFLMDKEENLYCLEANTLPGMTPTSLLPQEAAVEGIDFTGLCELIIEASLKAR